LLLKYQYRGIVSCFLLGVLTCAFVLESFICMPKRCSISTSRQQHVGVNEGVVQYMEGVEEAMQIADEWTGKSILNSLSF
jgi:hypothetical protein